MKTKLPLLATCLFAAPLLGANSSLIQSPLTNTGVDADATGRVLSSLTAKKSQLTVQVSKLAPGVAHQIEVDGVAEADFTTNAKGGATVKFRAPKPGKGAALDFDPRGKLLRVLSSGQSVLEATLSADGEPSGAVSLERVNLPLGPATGATGKATAEYRLDKKGRRTFKAELQRAGAGPFELFVAGVKRGDFTTVRGVSRIKFAVGSDDPNVLPLDFDPRGQVIDVIGDGAIVFSSELAAQALGVNVASPRLSASAIASTGADPDGHAEARLRIDDRARKHFSVEIEDVTAGTYDLLVDGEDVGDIFVTAVTGGTKGEIEFTSGDDDAEELPLTFDPVGKTLAVQQGAVVFFSGAFAPSSGNGSGTPAPEPPSTLSEDLASTGLDGGASASADYAVDAQGRHKFSVEIEDVAAGDYYLVVAGVVRGTIHATFSSNRVKGELEFDSKVEPGHRPLNFDPRGQLIEITSAAGTFFSHVLGDGSATTPGPSSAIPFEVQVPLLRSGATGSARAKAQLKQRASGEVCFEVEIEDIAAGSYDLIVAGNLRGTINVVSNGGGTRGKIEFETQPEAGDLLLNFDVEGQEIVVSQGGTTFFSRVFPTP